MITKDEILMGRQKEYPLSLQMETNLLKLLTAVNKLRDLYGKPMILSSGYRPGYYNVKAKGSKNSAHLTCEAVDFKDADGKLKEFITLDILKQCNLYAEAFHATPTWVHVQIRPTKGRIFTP